jgi:hypothetical protein
MIALLDLQIPVQQLGLLQPELQMYVDLLWQVAAVAEMTLPVVAVLVVLLNLQLCQLQEHPLFR